MVDSLTRLHYFITATAKPRDDVQRLDIYLTIDVYEEHQIIDQVITRAGILDQLAVLLNQLPRLSCLVFLASCIYDKFLPCRKQQSPAFFLNSASRHLEYLKWIDQPHVVGVSSIAWASFLTSHTNLTALDPPVHFFDVKRPLTSEDYRKLTLREMTADDSFGRIPWLRDIHRNQASWPALDRLVRIVPSPFRLGPPSEISPAHDDLIATHGYKLTFLHLIFNVSVETNYTNSYFAQVEQHCQNLQELYITHYWNLQKSLIKSSCRFPNVTTLGLQNTSSGLLAPRTMKTVLNFVLEARQCFPQLRTVKFIDETQAVQFCMLAEGWKGLGSELRSSGISIQDHSGEDL
ncbi:hypothetical protein H1R20_g10010, partial [Candolleomyces eurysporus]